MFPYFNAGTETGGSNSQTLTVNQLPPHKHNITHFMSDGGSGGNWTIVYGKHNINGMIWTDETGSGAPVNNMPAYQTLYAWRRTA